MTKNRIITDSQYDLTIIGVGGANFGLSMGDIREFVRRADAKTIDDRETVHFSRVQDSIVPDMKVAGEIEVRQQRLSQTG